MLPQKRHPSFFCLIALLLAALLVGCAGGGAGPEVSEEPLPGMAAGDATEPPNPAATPASGNEPPPAGAGATATGGAEPTSEPAASTPVQSTAEVVSFRPLDPAACESVRAALAQNLTVELTQAEAPFTDFVSGTQGTGCELVATGTGETFGDFVGVAGTVRRTFEALGWAEDAAYLADGPTGTATAFRQGAQLCLASVDWVPSTDANCPLDQPISACAVSPAQQLFTLRATCAQP